MSFDPMASAKALLRRAQKSHHRPCKSQRPRCGAPTHNGTCKAAKWWPQGEPQPRQRCRMHLRSPPVAK